MCCKVSLFQWVPFFCWIVGVTTICRWFDYRAVRRGKRRRWDVDSNFNLALYFGYVPAVWVVIGPWEGDVAEMFFPVAAICMIGAMFR